ncbi:hypothetical protein [Clostridium beijerinckii]|uniref:hypothetical protein n=1 Tax=Clostridium beijerinckii TaxID=1520 RepID=UPI001494CD1D|nr:hypothetical protein [Clostridium beijerinckii]NOW07214.1 hypothetical protein [Clostridium beijerinckii]NYC05012.1 hypothetical protein [Clostridium beijerinckii]
MCQRKNKKIKSYRILNLEGGWFDYYELEKNKYKFTFDSTADKTIIKNDKKIIIKPTKDKLFSATMPYSLETVRAFKSYPNEVLNDDLTTADKKYIENSKKELYTKLFVNFKFTKDLFDDTEEDISENELKKEIGNEDDETEVSQEIEETDDAENKDKKAKRINKKRVRELIYTSTVEIDGIIYSFFKRGASKARTANVIFAKKEYCDKLLEPCLLGLKFKENEKYDITSKEAYTSLIMSRIIGMIKIKKEEILIIDDLFSPEFPAYQTKTLMDDVGNVYQSTNDFLTINNMTDGQALADESLFTENELLNESTCALLRNDFLKANALRTKLQEYYKEIFKDNYETAQVYDMYRGWIPAKLVKLVLTPSSCKFLKFADNELFGGDKVKCFEHWLNNVSEEYGVVKTDHVGNYEYSNRLSYQMWNSLNLKRQEVFEIMQDELKYFKLLKDNTLIDSNKLSNFNAKDKKNERDKRNEMLYFLNVVKNDYEDFETGDMISNLLIKNTDFRFTKKFKEWKNKQLEDYIKNLRLGKIRIQNSLYAIMISCPYEMLQATHSEKNKIDGCIMDGWECYNPHYDEGTEFLAIRNPQINEGNIAHMVNKYHDEYKWFGYQVEDEDGNMVHKHDFVVFVNTWNVDIMNRLQGCDFDIDTCYLSDHKLLVQKAIDAQKYPTPVNGIEGSKEERENNKKSLAELDNYLGGSTMAIGKVVNKSAIFNAYMYDAINTGLYNEDYINNCYKVSSTLSSCSQISIDMAKKSFLDADEKPLSLTKIMNNLNKETYIFKDDKGIEQEEKILRYEIDRNNSIKIKLSTYLKELWKQENEDHQVQYELKNQMDLSETLKQYKIDCKDFKKLSNEKKEIIKNKYNMEVEVYARKMIVPKFFKFVAKNNSYRIPTPMECAMDYLEEIIDNMDTKAMKTDLINIKDLINPQKEFSGGEFSRTKIDKARQIIDNCQSILNGFRYDSKDGGDEKKRKSNIRKWAKKSAVKELEELELNQKTVLRIILRAFNLDDKYKGNKLKRKNKDGKEITYTDFDYELGEDVEYYSMVREFKEMVMLTLTLIYNSYKKAFIDCFKEKKDKIKEVEEYWK